jgi:uncharacterized protein YggT (Ycf19 family)
VATVHPDRPVGEVHEHEIGVVETPVVTTPVVTTPVVSVWPYARLVAFIYLIFGTLESLIGIRVVLKLLAANPQAGFTRFMYDVTAPFVYPFQGIFATPQSNGSILEFSSLLAIVIYALLAYLIVRIIEIVGRRRTYVTT